MAISREEVLKIARLAHIELDENKVEKYRKDLCSVLDHIDKLRDLDAQDARMTHPVGVESCLREDEVAQPLVPADVMRNAPDRDGDQFRVPKVLED
ncbi:Asp-tRNA(Asn)/Glu-tRNA(Gln) amidotransferase subunit GatC [Bradymonas sediminis]|nr:Asp-tRNA(Asn)/Glu-tRNA(Gln) amidotransferase subunit GatC [Bradymonas sediminis]TDP76410.1 aspartyl/glutamyl-tRNA(Asn/Gln) amidotransferase subunit C [Bradymonas sediminis]